MCEGSDRSVLCENTNDVGELCAPKSGVHLVTDWMLHPRVSREDEVRGEKCAGSGDPDGCEVKLLRETIPTEDPDAKEGGLEEEGEQALHRKRSTEDVTDEA
ncbi:unannotated protein [freshwater metagenome]|uniref:Unannotated protein n=1 Tax=freshwater metagenome TaxID=449393 RepID=A0A6J6P3H7_9ZZZZ